MLRLASSLSRPCSRYHALMATTTTAASANDEVTVWVNLSTATGDSSTSPNDVISLRTVSRLNVHPVGYCIHALATRIHSAERLAPMAVSHVAARWNRRLTLSQPKNITAMKVLSMKKAMMPSMASGAPNMSPTKWGVIRPVGAELEFEDYARGHAYGEVDAEYAHPELGHALPLFVARAVVAGLHNGYHDAQTQCQRHEQPVVYGRQRELRARPVDRLQKIIHRLLSFRSVSISSTCAPRSASVEPVSMSGKNSSFSTTNITMSLTMMIKPQRPPDGHVAKTVRIESPYLDQNTRHVCSRCIKDSEKKPFCQHDFRFLCFLPQAVFALAQDPTPADCGRRPAARQKPRLKVAIAGRGGSGEGRQQKRGSNGEGRQRGGEATGRKQRGGEAERGGSGDDKRRTVQGYSSPSRRRLSIPTIRGRACGR